MSSTFYKISKKILFQLDPEKAHDLALWSLKNLDACGLSLNNKTIVNTPTNVMGLTFRNQVGLAAGLDKNGDFIKPLQNLGFGFIELGTVTPKPQPGNPRPRLFRVPEADALVNRLGFNNKGVDYLIEQVKSVQRDSIIGINIGKNKTTPIEDAHHDYEYCLRKVYPLADYVTINISSPNTENLRSLQRSDNLHMLLKRISATREALRTSLGVMKPIAIKIAPDLDDFELENIVEAVRTYEFDGIIATNTTTQRPHREFNNLSETGGLSGGLLTQASTQIIQKLSNLTQGSIPIIGVGGILNRQDALDKISAGASLVQIYSGLIYNGPRLIRDCAQAISLLRQPGK
ncbi:MAG: quinone-dependent dihydroorotate dehydrogenase [Burkholderiales bacterium]|nr:quinone-dependent dihydroorotate dehydrogenase [Burkholderiales bacterium]|tara:strand:+ start:13309 stop:14346 length:1038 start_codon:yes stop_codon:yes gene_type:complete